MTTIVAILLLLLSGVELQALSDSDINATIDGAQAKLSPAEYFYLDDPSPGDYFDSIVSAAKFLAGALNQIAPRIAETMSGIAYTLRYTPRTYPRPYAKIYSAVISQCEMFDMDSALRMTTNLMGEQCDRGLGEYGSMEQYMQHRMMQFAKESGFEGANENNCLHVFIAHFTRSGQAVSMFKTAVDKYLFATTTVHAFCAAFKPTQSEEENRAKAVKAQRMLAKSIARVQLNDSESWTCDDTQSKIDASMTAVKVSHLYEIIENARDKLSSSDYFFNVSSTADFFDSVSTAARYLDVAQKATTTDIVMEKRKVIAGAFTPRFRDLSSITDEQAAPFGLNECWLLPEELMEPYEFPPGTPLMKFTVVPIISAKLDAMQAALLDRDVLVKACKASNTDDALKALKALIGNDCEQGLPYFGQVERVMQFRMMNYAEKHKFEGGTENNCLHLFVARYTKSEEAVHMFKKAFDKYLLATVTVQAFCSVFDQRCDEEEYRKHVIDTHASFAASLARTAAIQLNRTTPWKCDDSQHVDIAKMNATCELVMSTAASDTYFLGEMTPEEFENMTCKLADTLTKTRTKVSRAVHDALTPRKAEVYRRTLSALLDQMAVLMTRLAEFERQLSEPFGEKDDDLLPSDGTVFRIHEMFRKTADELNRSRDHLDEDYQSVPAVCVDVRTSDDLLKEIKDFVSPGCQNGSVDGYEDAERWRRRMLRYATTHSFDGCDENRCLQIFIVRYTNYSREAIENLRHSLDKYVFLSMFLKSFCGSYDNEDRSKSRNETIQVIRSMKDGMELLSNLSRHTESCSQATTTNSHDAMTTHGISTDISTEKSHDVTTNKPAGDARTTAPHAKGSTAREGDHSWREKVDSYAKDIIDSATDDLQPKSWKDRQSLHEAVANGIVKQFHESSDNNGYSFEALAYLPYNDDKRHAFIKLPDNIDVVRKEYKLVNYVVARRANAELGSNIRSHWDTFENNANAILEDTFSARPTDFTTRMEEVNRGFPLLTPDGFRALAALRCGYEFVWYELGYRYFPAGYATGKHTLLTPGGNEYTDKCGHIVFFP